MGVRKKVMGLLALYLLLAGMVSAYYGYRYIYFVETDNVRAAADLTYVKAAATGRVAELRVREGQEVAAGEPLADVEYGTASGRSREALVSPVAGRVLRLGVHGGEVVTAGQPLAVVADLGRPYLEARLAEKEAARTRMGQPVEIRLDTEGNRTFSGVVTDIRSYTERADWPVFSLTPPRQQPREEEMVLVKIRPLDVLPLPGTGGRVTIRVKEEGDNG